MAQHLCRQHTLLHQVSLQLHDIDFTQFGPGAHGHGRGDPSGIALILQAIGHLRIVLMGYESYAPLALALFLFAASLIMLTLFVFPLPAILLTTGISRLLNILIVLVMFASYADNEKSLGLKKSHAFSLPLMTCILIYIIIRSTAIALINKGIDWRGTHYPLKDLKANKV